MTFRDEFVAALEAEIEALQDRLAALEEVMGMRIEVPFILQLTRHEAQLFGFLLKRDLITKEQGMTVLYGDRAGGEEVEIKIIDVFVCKIRKKLKRFGIEIETVWGQGYRMSAASKAIVEDLLQKDLAA
ncbi:helix-turn-helix domain-containing protein [Rhodopseudomonas sp. RCAM05734]|uniref:helix-turn-helix domain-containing protein n=1 Tax=Rhodopseudomonas sp. RCAM05734 TaxID=3457549 RepID=UPI004044DA1A